MTEQFKRDMNRYIVIKRSDISKMSADHMVALQRIMDQANFYRAINDKEPLQCVVVESDWPEYERVWAMIEARVTGKPLPGDISDGDISAITLDALGKWPSFEAQSWACKVTHAVLGHHFDPLAIGQQAHQLAEFALRLNDGCCDGSGCKPTEEELKWLREGDYQPEELWGGKRPTCPKCAGHTLDHFSLDTGKVDQVAVDEESALNECIGQEEWPLPEWAYERSDGTLKPGLQLLTKNSRRHGNAFITSTVYDHSRSPAGVNYHVITDAGNRMVLTESELDEFFERGDFVSPSNKVPGLLAERLRTNNTRASCDAIGLTDELMENILAAALFQKQDYEGTGLPGFDDARQVEQWVVNLRQRILDEQAEATPAFASARQEVDKMMRTALNKGDGDETK